MFQMVGVTHSTSEDFGASGSGIQPPPLSIEELLATQNELLRQLLQGQLAIGQFLQQQYFQLEGHNVRKPQIVGLQELDEKTQEIRDVYTDSLMPPSQLPMKLKDDQVKSSTLKHGPSDIDLTGWEITCTEFVPRRRKTKGCFNCGNSTQFAQKCPQVTQQNQDQGSSQTSKSKRRRLRWRNARKERRKERKRLQDERKKQIDQVEQGRINSTTLVGIPEGTCHTFSIFPTHLAH